MSKNIELHLKYPFLYKWKYQGAVSLLTNFIDNPMDLLERVSNEEQAVETIKKLPGSFAVVINQDDFLFAAVDRIRSFPLFYKICNDKISITDDLSQAGNHLTDETSLTFFINNSCTKSNTTLLHDWKQLQPGEFLYYNKATDLLITKRYFRFEPIMPLKHLDWAEMKKIYLKTFRQILDQMGDRPIIVALSGGYDSRSIISVLTELKATNIFTYTYGVKNSFEKLLAEKIAIKLGLHWHFVEYTDKLLMEFFGESWKAYSDKNHNFSSLPGEQDFFALTYLKKKKLLPENGVVITGFLGDCLGGSMFKNDFITHNRLNYQDEHISNFACKYIVNTVRAYEYFGLEWQAVLMSPAILEAWFQISLKERCYKNGYNEFLSNTFFKPLEIDFLKKDHYYHPRYLKNYLKKYLPARLVKFIQKKKSQRTVDLNNVNFLNSQLALRLGKAKVSTKFNQTHAAYFLKNLKQNSEETLD